MEDRGRSPLPPTISIIGPRDAFGLGEEFHRIADGDTGVTVHVDDAGDFPAVSDQFLSVSVPVGGPVQLADVGAGGAVAEDLNLGPPDLEAGSVRQGHEVWQIDGDLLAQGTGGEIEAGKVCGGDEEELTDVAVRVDVPVEAAATDGGGGLDGARSFALNVLDLEVDDAWHGGKVAVVWREGEGTAGGPRCGICQRYGISVPSPRRRRYHSTLWVGAPTARAPTQSVECAAIIYCGASTAPAGLGRDLRRVR